MVSLIPQAYSEVLKRRDFLLLSLINFLFQVSTSFILLALIVTVFAKTGSNFGVSGVVLSFATPGIFLIFLGLAADLFDRKKLIIFANALQVLLIAMILVAGEKVFALILFSFLYFTVNSFFIPVASAAMAQVVAKRQLLAANSLYVMTQIGGQFSGFLAAAIINFFLGTFWTLFVCAVLTMLIIWLATLLPPLFPRKGPKTSMREALADIAGAFLYILRLRMIWFFFLMFAFIQGLIALGVTLGPGFFDEVVGLPIKISIILTLPIVIAGVAAGVFWVHRLKVKEGLMVGMGLGLMGACSFLLGLVIKLGVVTGKLLILPTSFFLVACGFGVIVVIIACRTVMQKDIAHRFQGTVFGAWVVAAAFFASVMSPAAAGIEAVLGYTNILIFGGAGFMVFALSLTQFSRRWKF